MSRVVDFNARSLARHHQLRTRLPRALPGPVLAVVQEHCDQYGDAVGALAPIFEDIARQVDFTLSSSGIDGGGDKLIVGLSDVAWGGRVLIAIYDVRDLAPITRDARRVVGKIAAECSLAANLGYISAIWSERARTAMRKVCTRREIAPDFVVGALLATNAVIFQSVRTIAKAGSTPALMIALNSTGTARARLKCRLRAFAIEVPEWAWASGAVAGHA